MNKTIEFLTRKMNELDKEADLVEKNKSTKYDEYKDLVEKITFLDELIEEFKREEEQ